MKMDVQVNQDITFFYGDKLMSGKVLDIQPQGMIIVETYYGKWGIHYSTIVSR